MPSRPRYRSRRNPRGMDRIADSPTRTNSAGEAGYPAGFHAGYYWTAGQHGPCVTSYPAACMYINQQGSALAAAVGSSQAPFSDMVEPTMSAKLWVEQQWDGYSVVPYDKVMALIFNPGELTNAQRSVIDYQGRVEKNPEPVMSESPPECSSKDTVLGSQLLHAWCDLERHQRMAARTIWSRRTGGAYSWPGGVKSSGDPTLEFDFPLLTREEGPLDDEEPGGGTQRAEPRSEHPEAAGSHGYGYYPRERDEPTPGAYASNENNEVFVPNNVGTGEEQVMAVGQEHTAPTEPVWNDWYRREDYCWWQPARGHGYGWYEDYPRSSLAGKAWVKGAKGKGKGRSGKGKYRQSKGHSGKRPTPEESEDAEEDCVSETDRSQPPGREGRTKRRKRGGQGARQKRDELRRKKHEDDAHDNAVLAREVSRMRESVDDVVERAAMPPKAAPAGAFTRRRPAAASADELETPPEPPPAAAAPAEPKAPFQSPPAQPIAGSAAQPAEEAGTASEERPAEAAPSAGAETPGPASALGDGSWELLGGAEDQAAEAPAEDGGA